MPSSQCAGRTAGGISGAGPHSLVERPLFGFREEASPAKAQLGQVRSASPSRHGKAAGKLYLNRMFYA